MSVLEQLQQEIEQMRDSYERGGSINTLKYQMSCYAYSFMVYLSEQGLEVKLVEDDLPIVDEVFVQIADLPSDGFERWMNMVAGFVGLVMERCLHGEWTYVADLDDHGHVAMAFDGNSVILVDDLKLLCEKQGSVVDYYQQIKMNLS